MSEIQKNKYVCAAVPENIQSVSFARPSSRRRSIPAIGHRTVGATCLLATLRLLLAGQATHCQTPKQSLTVPKLAGTVSTLVALPGP